MLPSAIVCVQEYPVVAFEGIARKNSSPALTVTGCVGSLNTGVCGDSAYAGDANASKQSAANPARTIDLTAIPPPHTEVQPYGCAVPSPRSAAVMRARSPQRFCVLVLALSMLAGCSGNHSSGSGSTGASPAPTDPVDFPM